MLEVEDHFHKLISSETFHLAVTYMDRYLSSNIVPAENMQELGVTSLFLASKFIDYQTPRVEEFAEITDHSVTTRQIMIRERELLKSFTCSLSAPTAYHFLIQILSTNNFTTALNRKIRRLALYLCDFARLYYELLIFPPRILAVACLFLAHITLNREFRMNSHREPFLYMNLSLAELISCTRKLATLENRNETQHNRSLHCLKRWQITRGTITGGWFGSTLQNAVVKLQQTW